ncbi:MAG: endonuclease [Deltaproteobacteria bacterium]|jgi:5-methylcytosine-specific restriction endonuclease McrA|nr:endonuclease [Deltaproteobacteria bacterium]MBP1719926.1 endonuclease [Deltaproteobacteria bacterium]
MVHAGVLVLNKSFLPVQITTVRRAFCLLYAGIAKAVNSQYETFDFDSWRQVRVEINDDAIGLVDRMIKVPRVILLIAYDRVPKRRVRFSRHNIFARDKNTCQYCGKRFATSDLNLDHVVPRSQGGVTSWGNVVCSCHRCNRLKGGLTPVQAGMRLISPPRKPSWTPPLNVSLKDVMRKEWVPFLDFLVDMSYWNTELLQE